MSLSNGNEIKSDIFLWTIFKSDDDDYNYDDDDDDDDELLLWYG